MNPFIFYAEVQPVFAFGQRYSKKGELVSLGEFNYLCSPIVRIVWGRIRKNRCI
jgi:hypothetical protein